MEVRYARANVLSFLCIITLIESGQVATASIDAGGYATQAQSLLPSILIEPRLTGLQTVLILVSTKLYVLKIDIFVLM